MSRALSSLDVADLCGITYRQLDHWLRRGYVVVHESSGVYRRRGEHGTPVTPGSGYLRRWRDEEVAAVRALAVLVNAGMRVDKAAAVLAGDAGVHVQVWPVGPRVELDVDQLLDAAAGAS